MRRKPEAKVLKMMHHPARCDLWLRFCLKATFLLRKQHDGFAAGRLNSFE